MRWLMVGLVACFFFACGEDAKPSDDDDGDGAQGGTGAGAQTGVGGATTTTTASTTTSAVGGGPAAACAQACSDLYDCGLELDGGMQLCPGFTGDPSQKDSFLFGSMNDGCLATCEGSPVLVSLVDPNDCPGTIQDISSVSSDFEFVCQNGF